MRRTNDAAELLHLPTATFYMILKSHKFPYQN